MSPTQLFVYGTLRSDPSHEMFHILARHAKFLGEARVAGRLFDLGEYPGMVLQPSDSYVKGELYDIQTDHWNEVIEQLDRYEGCTDSDPQPHEYCREVVQAKLTNGRTIKAWAYVLNRPVAGLSEITSGDYLSAPATLRSQSR